MKTVPFRQDCEAYTEEEMTVSLESVESGGVSTPDAEGEGAFRPTRGRVEAARNEQLVSGNSLE